MRKVGVAGMLGIILVVPFAALAGQAHEFLERGPAAPTAAARSPLALKEINILAPIGPVYQANPVILQHSDFPPSSPEFGAILSGALLLVPFALSALSLSLRNSTVFQLGAFDCRVTNFKRSLECLKVKIKACLRFNSRAGTGRISK